MIIFYNKKTNEVYGTQDGYKDNPDFWILPQGLDREDVGKIVVDREWEKDNQGTVASITLKRVKDVSKLAFEDDLRKTNPPKAKEGTPPCKQMLERYLKEIEDLKKEVVELKERK